MSDGRGTKREVAVRLYVSGRAPSSVRAIRNLRAIRDQNPEVAWRVELVDVLAEPRRSRVEGVLVTPTLIRVAPLPQVWVVGDLSRPDEIVEALGLGDREAERGRAGSGT